MAGLVKTIYAAAAITVAVLGLLFVMFVVGDRDRGLLVEGAIAIILLIGLGATLLV
ncbi:hypothetical protein [Haloplanus aerogenes]|uniref:Uncharacterized protein n=1 Tax=Haloplanus aerogenes TaxID=660522 RepID=A0A3M0DR15_9EURY|nr:hypothetical protein [Haloplanus aerogenes]RMB24118.1 hypothetical protein ATH50_1356 [Haloplanus aerogenes]